MKNPLVADKTKNVAVNLTGDQAKKVAANLEKLAKKRAQIFKARMTREARLLKRIKRNLKKLEKILEFAGYSEDLMYRFYHQSFKVYRIQELTEQIVAELQRLAPDLSLNSWFMEIVQQGTGREFAMSDNWEWTNITRPMLEAFFHARYFLEMICKFGEELESPPEVLPSGWAAVLYLYGLR